MSRVIGTTFAAVMALGVLGTSASADSLIRRDVQVFYGDLNISTEAGAGALLERIDHAALRACGGAPAFQPMYDIMPGAVIGEFNKCHRAAVAKAVASVGSPVLAHLYAQRGERPYQRFADR